MPNHILTRYSVILLDMNSTFVFGEDRFGADEDFFATYTALGGSRLDRTIVDAAIRRCFASMYEDYVNPVKVDDFPSVVEGLQRYAGVDDTDVTILETVFAHHEKGQVPPEFATCLRQLSRSHKLGLVSNIWARKDGWLAEFARAGIDDIWHSVVFSSDSRSMKPSPTLFEQAIADFDVPLSQMVFIGDSLRADVLPAKSLGLDTVWINATAETHPHADYVIPSLLQLVAPA
jgi:putative hydrolase of the HAD superfamily